MKLDVNVDVDVSALIRAKIEEQCDELCSKRTKLILENIINFKMYSVLERFKVASGEDFSDIDWSHEVGFYWRNEWDVDYKTGEVNFLPQNPEGDYYFGEITMSWETYSSHIPVAWLDPNLGDSELTTIMYDLAKSEYGDVKQQRIEHSIRVEESRIRTIQLAEDQLRLARQSHADAVESTLAIKAKTFEDFIRR
jgi:hypothetical protein